MMGVGRRPAAWPRASGVAVSVVVHAVALALWAAWPVAPRPATPRLPLDVRILQPGALRQPAPYAPQAPAPRRAPARPRPPTAPAAPPPARAPEPLRNPVAVPETLPEPGGPADDPEPDAAALASDGEGVVGGIPGAVAAGVPAGEGAAAPPDSPWAREQLTEIRRRVLAHLSYPRLARNMGWEGLVVVGFFIVPGGQADRIAVARSSGHEALDQAALEAVAASVPLPSPPAPQAILLPIRFRQER